MVIRDDHNRVGLVNRESFGQVMSGPFGFGRALWRRRPVAAVADWQPLVVPAHESVLVLVALVAAAFLVVSAAPAVAFDPADGEQSNDLRVSIGPATSSPSPTSSPTPTVTPTVTPTATADPPSGGLPRTGYSLVALVAAGVGLVTGGAGLRVLVRRRRG